MGDAVFDPADMELDMVDEVEPIIKKAIEENLAKAEYHGKGQMEQLSDKVHDYILKTLVNEVKKPFKYVITVTLLQKNGAGMFATASIDKTVKVWDTASGTCLATLEGHSGEVMGSCGNGKQHAAQTCGTTRHGRHHRGNEHHRCQPANRERPQLR